MTSSKNNTAELEAQIGERIRSRRIRVGSVKQISASRSVSLFSKFRNMKGGRTA
jgi:hypothetical protein